MSLRRREFLGSLGTASLAAALPLSSVGTTAPAPVANTWDMAWIDRVKGKYRAVFDSPGFSNGEALFRADGKLASVQDGSVTRVALEYDSAGRLATARYRGRAPFRRDGAS